MKDASWPRLDPEILPLVLELSWALAVRNQDSGLCRIFLPGDRLSICLFIFLLPLISWRAAVECIFNWLQISGRALRKTRHKGEQNEIEFYY